MGFLILVSLSSDPEVSQNPGLRQISISAIIFIEFYDKTLTWSHSQASELTGGATGALLL